MKYFLDTISSPAYWRYVLLSSTGIRTVLAIFGGIWLFIESLDFFGLYTRDQYGSYSFFWVMVLAAVFAILVRRPIRTIELPFPERDFCLEVRIGNIFDASGAIMVSTNTVFESDVAGGKISPESLQGQFTAKYFPGDQNALIRILKDGLKDLGSPPYPMGTTVPVNTHGKTCYFVVMAELNAQGTASTTPSAVEQAIKGLWSFVRESGELLELVVPVIGTARGRIKVPRKKIIEIIAASFVAASTEAKFTDRLVIMVRPEDAKRFQVNLYDIKDHLNHTLGRK